MNGGLTIGKLARRAGMTAKATASGPGAGLTAHRGARGPRAATSGGSREGELIERALAQAAGVVRSTADHRAARVTVVFDPGRTSAEAVQARIEQAGYEVVS